MAGQVGEAYKATQARREEYVFTSVRGRRLRYMQGREQETDSLCAGRGACAPHTLTAPTPPLQHHMHSAAQLRRLGRLVHIVGFITRDIGIGD